MKKTAFITGGSRGIGRGIVEVLARAGYDIGFTYNTKKDAAEELKKEVEALGRRCFYYQASMEKEGIAQIVTTRAITDLVKLDVLVCNAGLTVHNSILDMKPEDIDFAYNLDYRSYILCTKVAAEHMKRNQIEGNIIYISSTRGIRAYPEDPLYGGMKTALHRACESLALELSQYHIRINCVAPGATAIRGNFTHEELTGQPFFRKIPLGRAGTPKEVGELVKYLISTEAAYITGDIIRIDGGLIIASMPSDTSPAAGPGWGKHPRYVR